MDYIHKQGDAPLFPDILWSRPENKAQAGKFIIIGGSAHGFHSVFEAYQTALELGVGEVQLLLPDSLEKATKSLFENASYLQSTPSGSFSKKSFEMCLQYFSAADGVIISGDIENNSETSLLFEQLTASSNLPVAISSSAMSGFANSLSVLLARENTIACLDLKWLQKLAVAAKCEIAITSDMGQARLAEALHSITSEHKLSIMIQFSSSVFVASSGDVCISKDIDNYTHVNAASKAGVFLTQLPDTPFESLCSSLAV